LPNYASYIFESFVLIVNHFLSAPLFFYQLGQVQACHGLHLFEEVVDRACQVSHQVGVSEAQGNSQTTIKETAVVIGRVGQLTAGHNLIFSIAR
jgi:hypothetical protein